MSWGSRREHRRRLKLARASLFERLGSERYAKPALNGLDDLLLKHLPASPGFFVEAGGNDGYTQSNTYYLERFRGWRGLLVEPVPNLARVCRRVRAESEVVECALVSPEEAGGVVTVHYADLMSVTAGARGGDADDRGWAARGREVLGLDGEPERFRVPGRTLGSLLDHLGPDSFDLLSLDVEGYEVQVLQGLGRWRPTWLLVESHDRHGLEAWAGDEYDVVAEPTPLDLLLRRR